METVKADVVHTWTTAQLIEHLRATDPQGTSLVSLAGCLRISRVKRRASNVVDIESAEATSRDSKTGAITVRVLD